MSARQKLNHAYLFIAVGAATFTGFLFGSWFAFFFVLSGGLVLCLQEGSIRLTPPPPRLRQRRPRARRRRFRR